MPNIPVINIGGTDYDVKDKSARNVLSGFREIKSCYPIIYAYMKNNNQLIDRDSIRDYKINVYDVRNSKSIILNGTTANDPDFYIVMFLRDANFSKGVTLNVSTIKAGLFNSDVGTSSSDVTLNNYGIDIPSDCKYALVQNYYQDLTVRQYVDIYAENIRLDKLSVVDEYPKKYYHASSGLSTNASYYVKIYNVEGLETVFLKGQCRGTSSVCAYAFLTDVIGQGTLIAGEQCSGGMTTKLETAIVVPAGAKYIVTTSVYNEDEMCPYSITDTYSVLSDKNMSTINCIGDSLTMGAADLNDGQRTIYPYSRKLQELVGPEYNVTNQGIGGEGTLDIAARMNGICAVLKNTITIPYDRAWVDLDSGTYGGLLSIWDGSQVTPLLQGDALEGVYEANVDGARSYYVWINGIRCILTYFVGQGYKIVRVTASEDPNDNVICYAGTPVIFERMRNARNPLCNIYWCGTNDADKTDLVDKLKAMISYQNNENYIVIGNHNFEANSFTSEMRTAFRKAFGVRFFDIDYWTRTEALSACGIAPTSADNEAISNGLCPPSLMSDGVHFKTVVYQQIARRLYKKLYQIGVIDK